MDNTLKEHSAHNLARDTDGNLYCEDCQGGRDHTPATVYGDWAEETYPALIAPYRWNGWVVPFFDRETADRVVADVAKCHAEFGDDSDLLRWEGDVIVHTRPQYEDDQPTYIFPETDGELAGRYCIGGMMWTWSEVTE